MATTRYLVVVYVVTAGLHGDELGSDEEEIVLFAWLVVDISNCKVSLLPACRMRSQKADSRVRRTVHLLPYFHDQALG